MPKCLADRIIMFLVIGLVAWAIIGLPALHSFWPTYQPAYGYSAQPSANSANAQEPWLTKDAAGFFTFLLVVVGAFQVGLFLWQLWLIRESLDDAKTAADAAKEAAEAGKLQAGVAEKHADIAGATLKTMQETAQRQLRAYIFIVNGRVERLGDNRLKAALTIKNFGATPAYQLTHQTAVRIVPNEEPTGYSQEGVSKQVLLIPPNADAPLNCFSVKSFELDDHRAYAQDQCHIFVYGTLNYLDAFGRPQTTHFRFEVTGDIWASRGHLQQTEDGNDAT